MAKIIVKSGREYDCGSETPLETVEAITNAKKNGSFCVVCGNACIAISEIEAVVAISTSEDDLSGSRDCGFSETAKAIDGIKDERLKQDFSDLFMGIEYGIKSCNYEVANDCIAALRTLAHSLCRTIGGSTAVAVIERLASDAERTESKMLRAPIWSKGKRCDVGGTATCISATNNKCNSDSTGCISTGTGIAAGYVWGVTLLAQQ